MVTLSDKEHVAKSATSTSRSQQPRPCATPTIMQAPHLGYDARHAWLSFNALHQKLAKAALPDNRPRLGKRERRREQRELTARSAQDWQRIRVDNPENHVQLKLRLGRAIQMSNGAYPMIERARSNLEAQRASGLDEPAEIYESLNRAQALLLTALNELETVEILIGRAADFIRAHTEPEIALLRRNIADTEREVATRRLDEEGNSIGTTFRRDTFMRNSQPTPPRGGRQWYHLLANGPLSNVGLCLSGDEHDRIVDRLVMKDMWFTGHHNLWTNKHFWYGKSQDPTSKIPYEVHIMGHLTATGSTLR